MNEFLVQYAFIIVPIIKVAILVFVVLTLDAYLTLLERKVIAHIQARWGPHRTGPHGLLQPLADGIKFILKEDPMPDGVDKMAYFFAPFLTLMLALSSLAVIPFGPDITIFGYTTNFGIADVNISLLALFAITALSVYGVALAGWGSNSKYSLLGGLRSSAQMISYELSLTLSVVGVLLIAGDLSLKHIVEQQLNGNLRIPRLEYHRLQQGWRGLYADHRLHLFLHLRDRGDESRAVRLAGSGIGTGCGIPHGIRFDEIRDVFHRRIHGDDCGLFLGHDSFFRRLAVSLPCFVDGGALLSVGDSDTSGNLGDFRWHPLRDDLRPHPPAWRWRCAGGHRHSARRFPSGKRTDPGAVLVFPEAVCLSVLLYLDARDAATLPV